MENVRIYGIKYAQEQVIDKGYIPYFNPPNLVDGYLFEYKIIQDIITTHEIPEEYLGIFSWKFPLKTNMFSKKLLWLLKRNEGIDVYTFCHKLPENYMDFSEKQHPGLINLVQLLCKELNLQYYQNVKNIIYSNFFIAKTEIYKHYYYTILKPSILLLKEKYWELANKDANYKSGISSEKLEEQIGMNYYNMITFCFERMFSQYLMNNKYKVKELL